MHRPIRSQGFSLVELLLVMAMIGAISAIAIPTFTGQRRRARVIGDAMSNAKVLQMALELRKAEVTVYGTAGTTYTWTAAGARPAPDLAPTFHPQGTSKMDYAVQVTNGGLSYVLTVTDTTLGGTVAYQTNEVGAELARLQ